jgi:predicted DNA-binding transcriptional regulator YafY
MKFAVRPALRRFALVDERLRSRSWPNASSLARDLEVTPRTIHRDVEFLRDQYHAPIAFDPRKNGYYYAEASYALPYFRVSEGECLALFLAERLLQQYRGTRRDWWSNQTRRQTRRPRMSEGSVSWSIPSLSNSV